MFWGGLYHSPKGVSGSGFLYNTIGYFALLCVLTIEKYSQHWLTHRFHCNQDKIKLYRKLEKIRDIQMSIAQKKRMA